MSKAYKCDRCGCLYERYGGISFIKNGPKFDCVTIRGNTEKHYDFCSDCMKGLIHYLAKGEEEHEQN